MSTWYGARDEPNPVFWCIGALRKFMIGLVLQAALIALAGIPIWLFLWMNRVVDPTGLWQNFAVYSIGILILGSIQISLLRLGFWCSAVLWVSIYPPEY